ncbi:MAG: DUF2911 domain-containing protein [Ferruginibacter sp.]|nr:DUF2911 domain-containing protein [Cytophagales bacterium]
MAASLLGCCLLLSGVVRAQINTPQPSPSASLTQKVGLTDVSVSYSRPSAKGRKVFGKLLPYGKLWRTGANVATKLVFSDEVMLEGKNIPAGEYSLFTIPNATEWTVILNKNPKASANEYKQEEDAIRFTVKPAKTPAKVETFTIQFADLTPTAANLELLWENTLVRVRLTTDVESKVMAQIKEQVIDATPTDPNVYFQAASYYYEAGKDPEQALAWVNKATEKEPVFWMVHVKAKIQARLKDYKGAIASATQSIELAKTAKNDDYVRLNEQFIAENKGK